MDPKEQRDVLNRLSYFIGEYSGRERFDMEAKLLELEIQVRIAEALENKCGNDLPDFPSVQMSLWSIDQVLGQIRDK